MFQTIETKVIDPITTIYIKKDSAGVRYLTLGSKIYKVKEKDTIESLISDIEGFVNIYNDHDDSRPRVFGTRLEIGGMQ